MPSFFGRPPWAGGAAEHLDDTFQWAVDHDLTHRLAVFDSNDIALEPLMILLHEVIEWQAVCPSQSREFLLHVVVREIPPHEFADMQNTEIQLCRGVLQSPASMFTGIFPHDFLLREVDGMDTDVSMELQRAMIV